MYIDNHTTQFINNYAQIRGGAIHSHHSYISLLTNSIIIFDSNKASYGADISFVAGISKGNSCLHLIQLQQFS